MRPGLHTAVIMGDSAKKGTVKVAGTLSRASSIKVEAKQGSPWHTPMGPREG